MQYDARVSEYLLELLRSALNNTTSKEKPEDVSWNAVYALAHKHSVTALAFFAIQKLKNPPEQELFQIWQTQNSKILVKGANQENELALLSDCFEKNAIAYMPLKGSVIRDLFPLPYLREMSDLDILIPAEKLQQACELCEAMGYQTNSKVEHHVELRRLPYMNIELHMGLIASSYAYFEYYKDPWAKAYLQNNNYRYAMRNEDLYLYFLTHAAKHYINSGTGIRSVIDIYVFNRAYRRSMDTQYIAQELKKLNLERFARQMEQLAQYWFAENRTKASDDVKEMQSYVLSSATYGTKSNRDANQIRRYMQKGKSENGAKTAMYLHMAFLPCDEMQLMFPILKKAPVLLPFCWIARWFRIILTKPKSITDSYKRVQDIQIYDRNKDS